MGRKQKKLAAASAISSSASIQTEKFETEPKLEPEDLEIRSNQEIVTKSRVVFIATVCHICKSVSGRKAENERNDKTELVPGGDAKLFTCGSCRMISYCSKEHQTEDWENHKQFCRIVKKILKKEKKNFLYEGVIKYSLTDESKWLQIRHSYMSSFSEQLKRELEPYEKEILLFPRICFYCHNSREDDSVHLGSGSGFVNTIMNMKTCEKCCVLSYCSDHHVPNFSHDHCNEFKLWLSLIRFEHEYGLIRPQFNAGVTLNSKLCIQKEDFPKDMSSFFENLQYGSPFLSKTIKDVWLAGVTDVATVPLSILWTIKSYAPEGPLKNKLTIHLLGAGMDFEGSCPSKWETFFLHLLPDLKYLKVILVGPELPNYPPVKAEVCFACKSKGLEFSIEHRPGFLYHEYVKEKDFIKPDIICAFNCGIYRRTGYNGDDTWAPTIPLLDQVTLFTITTAYTGTESEQDRSRILSECPGLKSRVFLKNPFRSLRPQRTLVNENMEPLMYKNQYINIFMGG